ncbi:SURF1 family protein [Sphingomonas glacialis]|uniref:SURF1-like protein n=1 Tax=Sphingomonas glacialis TaxID=658225 RepID=A0A502FYX5_9SPHN|nr:SURF1 family protein [Sphingomonas glacialis]TPG54103.1 SURF1 family protein [Sphingomonas glacialis]
MRRSPATMAALLVVAGVLCAGLIGLGIWQIERLSWKRALIASVEQRVHAAPVLAPGPDRWATVSAAQDGYRHVRVAGRYRDTATVFVQAVTERGPGFWAMTPLLSDRGFTVLINRGFVTTRQAPAGGAASVSGLLRPSEPGGGFLRRNDPAANRWYSRDVAAIAAAQRLGRVAPYFIDADAGPPGSRPVGGLTVIRFPNNHLVYALTWFVLAAMVAGAGAMLVRSQRRGAA